MDKLVTMATKLPGRLRDTFADLAKSRQMTPSALMRGLVERELAGGADGTTGEVEAAVGAEIVERGHAVTSARAATALNLARRMDRDPTSGAANALQLQRLLTELVPIERPLGFDQVAMLRLQGQLKQAGFLIVSEDAVFDPGSRFKVNDDWRPVFESCVTGVTV